jgi:serine/threonine-protein kinase HipA
VKQELLALLSGQEIGRIHRDGQNRLTFIYDKKWRQASEAYPLSLSMPLAAAEHPSATIAAFLWGLLPDNEQILERWARRFQISGRNVFGFITQVGEDCAGAVQFVPEDRVPEILSSTHNKIEWLDEHEVAERLHLLRKDYAAWRLPSDIGQFSLAGAQPKTALLFEKGKWAIPSGRIPTTHILKPPTGHFDGHAENEHICLSIARDLGLPVARSSVMRFDEEIAIVIERYDRQRVGNNILRIHQEDICQALGLPPSRKYQSDQGPSPRDIISLLRANSTDPVMDVDNFVHALGFNWLIAGTDAHAKNYSLLIAEGPRVRLAPLYDIASIMPYDRFDMRKVKLAMKIGGEYQLCDVGLQQWIKFAQENRIDAGRLIHDLRLMAEQLPDAISDARKRTYKEGLDHKIITRLAELLTKRAKSCAASLAAASAAS